MTEPTVPTGDTPTTSTPPAGNAPPDDNIPPAGDTPPVDDNSSTDDGDNTPPPGEGGSDDSIVPESYADFTLPDEMVLQEGSMNDAAELFKADGLTQGQAQKYVDIASGLVQQTLEEQAGAHEQLKQDWATQSKADAEFGGDKFDESVALAQSVLDKVGTPALNALLQETGIGSHPEMLRVMSKIGALMTEDKPGGGLPNSAATDRISVMYPSSA